MAACFFLNFAMKFQQEANRNLLSNHWFLWRARSTVKRQLALINKTRVIWALFIRSSQFWYRGGRVKVHEQFRQPRITIWGKIMSTLVLQSLPQEKKELWGKDTITIGGPVSAECTPSRIKRPLISFANSKRLLCCVSKCKIPKWPNMG